MLNRLAALLTVIFNNMVSKSLDSKLEQVYQESVHPDGQISPGNYTFPDSR
jgi:hypothetical protein